MQNLLPDHRTLSFYLWELQGRGWDLFDTEVYIEPMFQGFTFDPNLLATAMAGDPKNIFLSFLGQGFSRGLKSPPKFLPSLTSELETTVDEFSSGEIVTISLNLSSDEETTIEEVEQFLLHLNYGKHPLGFELIGTKDAIHMQFACNAADAENIREQARVHFPWLAVSMDSDKLTSRWDRNALTSIVELGLEEEFFRPLRTVRTLQPDPLTGVIGVLEGIQHTEVGALQILFLPARNSWVEGILHSVQDENDEMLFMNAPEMSSLAREKISHLLFVGIVRVVGQASTRERASQITKTLSSGLRATSRSDSNSLIELSNEGYDVQSHKDDVLRRSTHRTGMILNARELAGFVHPISPSVGSSKIRNSHRMTRAVPEIAVGRAFVLGENVHLGKRIPASLDVDTRLRHTHIIGKTGMGKSTLLINLVKQDIEAGRGVAVLDPHGDLIERIVECLPDERIDDVILFDPADTEHPVGLNILEAHSEMDRTVLASDLVQIFRRFSTSWGDQMTAVLANAITAILESKEGGTLVELKRFLLEKEFRTNVLRQGVDKTIVYFWEREYPLMKGGSHVSIIARLDAFLRSRPVRNILSQRHGINFSGLVEGNKILLARLSQGIIGEENSHLLGSLICTKLHQVVMGRQAIQVSQRTPFFLYVDEFQHFVTPSMSSILTGSRKYAFGLTLAHQELHQIEDSALAASVIANPATRICFALGDNDAQKLQAGFAHFDNADLMNLSVGEAIVRVGKNESDFNITTVDVPPSDPALAESRISKIVKHSREQYGKVTSPGLSDRPPSEKLDAHPVSVEARSPRNVPPNANVDLRKQETSIHFARKKPVAGTDTAGQENFSLHRRLQVLVKKMAEQRGYRATIEEPIPDGTGRVDVGLERNGKKIAVEISVTTGNEQELHNIEKCLHAGYDSVIACSKDKKGLEAVRKLAAERLPIEDQTKVQYLEPEDLFAFLDDQIAREEGAEIRMKGYRVKVEYQAVSDAERKWKRDAISQVIAQSIRRTR